MKPDHLASFTTDLQLGGKSPRTCVTYTACVRYFAAHLNIAPADATREHIAAFVTHLAHERRMAPSTVKNHVCALRFYYEFTQRRPDLLDGLRIPRVTPKSVVVLSPEEIGRLLRCFRSATHFAIASLLYGTGMRIGEALAITTDDIDAARGVIVVRHTKNRRPRVARLTQELLSRLRHYWRVRRPPGPLVFPGKDPTRPIDPSAVQNAFKQAARLSGLTKPVTPHVLRHTYATHMLESGVDIHTV